MHADVPAGLAIAAAETDADLEAMVAVRSQAEPDLPPPPLENLRHNLASMPELVFLVARLAGEPVGCGFVYPIAPDHAEAHLVVIPNARRRGIGSALLAEMGARAAGAGKEALQGEARADDDTSRGY